VWLIYFSFLINLQRSVCFTHNLQE
jgi:hypothetical protein